MRVAVVGSGWAGLAAAVRATQAGHAVDVLELAPMPGGRARSDEARGDTRDNGQHILLGAYARTLALMRDVGVDPDAALLRLPLTLVSPDGAGLALRGTGPRLLDAARALLQAHGFTARDKLSLLRLAADWRRRSFRCDPALTVDALLRGRATARVRGRLLEPLCVAALNTPVATASAAVFLAVLRDSLFGGRDASDLLLPRVPLSHLLPVPATAWLRAHGAQVQLRRRVVGIRPRAGGWHVALHGTADEALPGLDVDAVVLATPATEAARLVGTLAPAWSACAAGLRHEPIATLRLRLPVRRWPAAMLALDSDAERRPAQFAFKAATVGMPGSAGGPGEDIATLVVSAAGSWLDRGGEALARAACEQVREAFGIARDDVVECIDLRADRRATFRCEAGVERPPAAVAPRLLAAGDYVDSPYPATLEAAVRAGEAAAGAL